MSPSRTLLTALDTWTPLRAPYNTFFTDAEINTLINSTGSYNKKKRTIVITAFENEYAYLGGLASVTKYLPHNLVRSGERVVFISPFYKNIPAVKNGKSSGEITELFSNLPCKFTGFKSDISCYQKDGGEYPCYYIDCNKYFEAHHDPYDYDDKSRLVNDALTFSCAVPFILHSLGLTDHILIHCHDWETALLSLSSKIAVLEGLLHSVKTVLTLHNSYDAELPKGSLKKYFGKKAESETVLQVSIPLLDGPLTTVSEPFAFELKNDPLQKEVFADHLQAHFSMNPPIGIGNGMFKTSRQIFSKKNLAEAKKGIWKVFDKKKSDFYLKLVDVLSKTTDERITGRLDFSANQERTPVFLMSGRFDVMQKGYDVIFHAFKRLKRGRAKLIFSPSNPMQSGNSSDYSFFIDYVGECEGDITIWPFIIPRELYQYFICGSSFLVMPSFYEPFGAATEGFFNGTPVLARGTGGLWEQVLSAYPCYAPSYYSSFLDDVISSDTNPTGILFREEYDSDNVDEEWRKIFSSPLSGRRSSKLYQAMVDSAVGALEKAIDIFHDKKRYSQLIMNGLCSLERFKWKDTIEKYRRIYSCTERNML